MNKKLLELKRSIDKKSDNRKAPEDGRYNVSITIDGEAELFSPLSENREPRLSSEVAEFIECTAEKVPRGELVRLNIITESEVAEGERERIGAAVQRHFIQAYEKESRQRKKLRFIALIMAIIGVLALTVVIGLGLSGLRGEVTAEVIDIFAWVFIWEAIDIYFLRSRESIITELRYLALAEAEICFPTNSKE
jgi:hypothetical protein